MRAPFYRKILRNGSLISWLVSGYFEVEINLIFQRSQFLASLQAELPHSGIAELSIFLTEPGQIKSSLELAPKESRTQDCQSLGIRFFKDLCPVLRTRKTHNYLARKWLNAILFYFSGFVRSQWYRLSVAYLEYLRLEIFGIFRKSTYM